MSLADGSARRAGLVGTLGAGALVTAAPLEGIPTTMLLEALGAWVPWQGSPLAAGAVALAAIGGAVARLYGVVFEGAARAGARRDRTKGVAGSAPALVRPGRLALGSGDTV